MSASWSRSSASPPRVNTAPSCRMRRSAPWATARRPSPSRSRPSRHWAVGTTAPWWTPQHATWALAVTATVALLAFAWVMTLRKRVQDQSAIIWRRVKHETELQERQRMARQLHDTLEQNLAGIGLSLEAVSLTL